MAVLGFPVIPRAERAVGDYTPLFIIAASMASFNIGIYYVLAALYNMKRFYLWTVPFRVVTFTVFTLSVLSGIAPGGFFGVGLWELLGALVTGGALYYERRRAGMLPTEVKDSRSDKHALPDLESFIGRASMFTRQMEQSIVRQRSE